MDLNPEENEDLYEIKDILSSNPAGCDFALCLFAAAANSYRVDRCLRPFPSFCIQHDHEKDFKLVRSTCDRIPPISEVIALNQKELPGDLKRLLKWLLSDKAQPKLLPRKFDDLPKEVIEKTNPKPKYVFQVSHQDKVEQTWLQRVGGRQVFYAFHGSSVDNFYSILKVGLQQHFCVEKELLYGNGIYLSSELSVSTHYSPFGETWKKSSLGHRHSVIAVCQVINDLDKVRCKDVLNKTRALNANSFEIPEKYFVVTDSDMVRVMYLLVYEGSNLNKLGSILRSNALWIGLVIYFALLACIGCCSNSNWTKFFRQLYNRL